MKNVFHSKMYSLLYVEVSLASLSKEAGPILLGSEKT